MPLRHVKKALRKAFSFLPVLGLRPLPDRPNGISAVMRVKNEEDWLEISIRSLLGFADQIVIGDNGSTDRTPMILDAIRRQYPDIIQVYTLPDMDILALTNRLIAETRYRWIIRWDADFVAQTDGPCRISLLKEWLFNLPANRYFFFYLPMVELAGDLKHQDPRHPTRADACLWTASPSLRYVYDRAGYESPRVPIWYEVQRWGILCFYHVHVKTDERLFYNYLWKHYLTRLKRDASLPQDAFFKKLCRYKYGHEDLSLGAKSFADEYAKTLVPFDAGRYSDYPALLKRFLAPPRYEIRYDNGKIVGRTTHS